MISEFSVIKQKRDQFIYLWVELPTKKLLQSEMSKYPLQRVIQKYQIYY